MGMRSLKSRVTVSRGIAPAGNRTTGTVNGTGVTMAGVGRALVRFDPGTITDGTHTPSVEESDASGSGYAAVAAGDLDGTLAVLASNVAQVVGYLGKKAFIRPVVVSAGTTTGGIFQAEVITAAR
jgi:hypothetical protein